MVSRPTVVYGLSCLAWLVIPAIAESQSAARGDEILLSAGRVVRPDGTLRDTAVVQIRNGKIQQVTDGASAGGPAPREFGPRAVICPGLVDLLGAPGAVGQLEEDAKLIDPEASPVWALNPADPDFRQALEAGMTSVMIGPAAENLVNGVCVANPWPIPNPRA